MDDVPPIQQWSTDDVPAAQRVDYYADALAQAMTPVKISTKPGDEFGVEMVSSHFGPIALASQVGSAHKTVRGKPEIARDRDRCFYLVANLRATWTWSFESGGPGQVKPGDCVLVDSNDTFALSLESNFEAVNLRLDDVWLRQWIAQPERLVRRRISSESGWGRALFAFVAQLPTALVGGTPLPSPVLIDQIGALLSLTANEMNAEPPQAAHSDRDLHDAIRERINERCHEASLAAADLAASLSISTRTLHRRLSANGTTFIDLLLEARTKLALRMLSSGQFHRLTTAEIGRRAGFSDASHFVRVMRRKLGRTPRELRQMDDG